MRLLILRLHIEDWLAHMLEPIAVWLHEDATRLYEIIHRRE